MRVVRLVLWAAATSVLLFGGWLTLGAFAAGRRLRSAEGAWARSFPRDAEPLVRFPRMGANASAREVERLAARLGISAVPSSAGRIQPAGASGLDRALVPVVTLVTSQRTQKDDVLGEPPADAVALLTAHAAAIEALESHLLRAPPPQWDRDLEAGDRAPLPRLGALRLLHSLLLGRALVHAGRGDPAAAGRALAAADRLTAGLRDRPEVIVQLVAIGFDGLHLGVVRKAAPVLAGRDARPSAHDYRRSMASALRVEAWSMARRMPGAGVDALRLFRGDGDRRLIVALSRPLLRPYLRLSAADSSQRVRQMALTLQGSHPCALDEARVATEAWREMPRWNVIGREVLPGLLRVWFVAGHHERESELTRRVLDLQTTEGVPGEHASEACPGLVWRYEAVEDGLLITVARDGAASAIGPLLPRGFLVTRGRRRARPRPGA